MSYDNSIVIGKQYKFAYPVEFTTMPDYSAHRGETVTVLRLATKEEHDPADYAPDEYVPMFQVQASDGWTGLADATELEDLT